MQGKTIFVIGSPRSGTTLLARMLGSHSLIYARPEPHLLTPLAHLGYYANVEKAPYDAVLAAEAQRQFVEHLPGGEQDYLDACRAYADTLYERMLDTQPGKELFLDKTPAYALVLDFIAKLYPGAHYVVLTRHPLAVFASYAESFFNGDFQAAHAYNPILERYVPAIARFLRTTTVRVHHIVYETMVADPVTVLSGVFAFLGVADEPQAVDYGRGTPTEKGLGDPIGIGRHSRPSTESVEKWAAQIASDRRRVEICHQMIDRLDPDDLALWGHPSNGLWKPLERASGMPRVHRSWSVSRYKIERLLIVRLRRLVGRHPFLQRWLRTLRLGSDVLLRE